MYILSLMPVHLRCLNLYSYFLMPDGQMSGKYNGVNAQDLASSYVRNTDTNLKHM